MENWDIMGMIVMGGIFYCVFGNIAAFLIAFKKGLKPSFIFSSYPFHVYRVCMRSPEKAGKVVIYLSLSSSIGLFLVVPLAMYYSYYYP